VTDTGPGIPSEHLPHIFDRFYKADAARAGTVVPSGSGLGLSIVRAIVLQHGGEVGADNVPGWWRGVYDVAAGRAYSVATLRRPEAD
jgi:signal transduction histidine kinase